jgi:Flp pilus assembly secretin CpaC
LQISKFTKSSFVIGSFTKTMESASNDIFMSGERPMFKPTTKSLALILAGTISVLSFEPAKAEMIAVEEKQPVIVTVDRAKVFRISSPAATVIVGNPAIADATVEDDVTLILTGRSFGVTNLIVIDREGNPIVDETIIVRGHEENTVRIYRREERVTLACAPVCEPTLTIGDDPEGFDYAQQQIVSRNALSESAK